MSAFPFPSPEALLAHRRFLRPIVHALLRGGDGEDDVVQETLVRAWQAGSTAPLHPGSWLGRVARNLSLDHLRAARRAANMRRQLLPRDAAPSADEVLQQEEQRRRVVQAVLALPQPYRAVVLLRYWEELTPAAIAARLGVPGATVRSQLLRGIAMLRQRLDADYGDRSTWIVALVPFGGGVRPLAWGTLLMTKTKLAVACTAVLAALLAALWWQIDPLPAAPVDGASPPPTAAPLVAGLPPAAAKGAPAAAAAQERVAAAPIGELAVRGQVLHKGAPYPGLTLTLQWFRGLKAEGAPESTFPVACDVEGRFEWFGSRREAPSTVVVVAPQQPLKLWCTGELVLPEQREATLEVSVIPFDRVLSGRVHDRAGAGVAGARLDVNLWAESAAVTDANGHYEMRVPAPGYPLLVRAAGYLERLVQGYLPADAMRQEFDVELLPGTRLGGRVVDGAGQPVAAAKIRASSIFDTVETDAGGNFVVNGVAEGQQFTVTVSRPGFQAATALGIGGGEPIEVVLQPGLAIVLRAVDPRAAPVVGARVNLVLQPMSGWTRLGVTGPDGRFTVADLPSRPVEVIVEKPGFITGRRTVDAREQTGELTITLAPGQTIHGQVVDSAGQPIAGASVYCLLGDGDAALRNTSPRSAGSRASTGSDGRFEVTGLPAETCTLIAHHPDYTRVEFVFLAGAANETTLRMQRAPAVAGVVLDGTTGVPIPKFTVAVEANPQPMYLEPMPFQAPDGRFRLRHWELRTGPLCLIVTAAGYAPARIVTEALPEPAADQNIVRLVAGTRVEGVVRDPASGLPVAGVTVALVQADRSLRPNEGPATDATGRFSLESVAPGEQRLRLQHNDRPEVMFGPFLVGPGPGTLEVRPTMSTGVALRGRVTGAPDAAGLLVQAYRSDGRVAKATVRDDLTFEVTGLGAGRTMVQIAGRTGRARTVRVEVGDRDVDGVVLPFCSGTGAVRVTVDGAASGIADLRRLDAPASDAGLSDSVEWKSGTFVVDGLAPGRYRVAVYTQDGKQGNAEVVVPAGEVPLHVECRAKD